MNRNELQSQLWSLEGARARLACHGLAAEVDVEQPMLGLTGLQWNGQAVVGAIMGVDVREAEDRAPQRWIPADVYTRGGDLVATYREPAGQPFHLQLYWRAVDIAGTSTPAIEMVISIQTPRWEAYPHISMGSTLAGARCQLAGDGVVCSVEQGWCYVEASPPGDFTPVCSRESGVDWSLAPSFMERGVIRRLRLRGTFAPADDAAAALEQLCAAFASEPPPLTA